MIFKFFESIIERLRDPSQSFRERVFIALTFLTDFVITFALIFNIMVGENIVEIIVLVITVIVAPAVTLVSIRKNKTQIAIRVIVIGLIAVILPILYFFGGGLTGGGFLWIVFTYLYTGLVLYGKWRPITLAILTIETVLFFVDAYFHPQHVHVHNQEVMYIDILVSVIMLGIICCLMVWFVEWMFIEENKRAREETVKFEELNKSQNRFFSSMSHEIRTPINTILGLNEIILRQQDASDEIKKDAANIQGAGKMLLSLVNDILDISKIEAGKMDIVPVNYSVSALVSEMVNMVWLRAEQKGLKLKVEVDPTLPRELFGDEVRIKQILINLLNNAVKYTNEGTVTLHIEKEEIKEEKVRIVFSVADTGMGIKEESLPYLFDAFQRMDEERNSKIEGTGLGLSIVKQLVELMEGEIAVNSVYTQGSTFTVTLWQKVSNPAVVGNINITNYGSLRDKARYNASFTAPDARILIVDDNEMNLEVEKKLLAQTQIIVDVADSGEKALSLTSAVRYDVIFMDHLMPLMNGIECLQAIRKQRGGLNNHAPVIVLTANAGSDNRELYNASGFDGYLLKPISGALFEEMLLAHLPESKVVLTKEAALNKTKMNASKGYSRKIPLLITTNSMCDLPSKTLQEVQIDTIPFKILSEGKEYYDGIEADADEIIRYMKSGKKFVTEPPTVEEYEQFFSKELKKAHQLIYITMTPGISLEYERAKQASKTYGNVFVFNSGYTSSAMGILAIIAHNMAFQGMSPVNILSELSKAKKNMRCSFVSDDPAVLFRRGIISKKYSEFMESVGIRPFVEIKNDVFKVSKMQLGSKISSYDRYVDFAIPRRIKPDTDVVIVVYSDVTDENLEKIEAKIRSCAPFKNVIFQKASASLSVTCGSGAFGIIYMKKTDYSYNLEKYLVFHDVSEPESSHAEFYGEENIIETSSEDIKWYDNIPGLDSKIAIEHSGSEESFKSVLKIFYDSLEDRDKELSQYYDSGDYENYTIKVHALKSSAALIGAMELSEKAKNLEMAGKENNISYIRKHHQEVLDLLRNYKKPLGEVFAANNDENMEADTEPKTKKADYNEFLIKSMYEAIKEGIRQNNDNYLKGLFKEMEDYELGEHQERFLRLKELFEASDHEGMENVLKEIQ
ncbi:DegV family protein [Butyrivibrio sp. INlla14]|uniref:DegV family protein n=1 Tax=Butyrivibrio sp. INlla14 TaxID=1520808 RepID=UPI0008763B56|nr:DegV family protein [Butyrivibrio sp. INlla14]SCY20726.1 EDD domain protein, DegV family [Butyrivibrio sp. INlla14]